MSGVSGDTAGSSWFPSTNARSFIIALAVAALLFTDIVLGGVHVAEMSTGLVVVVALIALGARYPAVALCTVIGFVPLQLPILAWLYKQGLPNTLVKDLGYIKDAGVVCVVVAMFRDTPGLLRRIQLDFLDWCAIAYVGIATIYLILPSIHQSGLGGGQSIQIRLNAWRIDCLFIVLMFVARRVTWTRRQLSAARNTVIAVTIVMLAIGIWESVDNVAYNNFLVTNLRVQDYQYYVLNVSPPYGFNYVDHTTIAGVTVTRVGSLFTNPIDLGFYMLIPLGLALERLLNHRLTPWVVIGVGASAVTLVLAATRSPILGGVVAIVLSVALAFRLRSAGRYRTMVLVIVAAVLVVPLSAGSAIRDRFSTTFDTTSNRDTNLHESAIKSSFSRVIHDPLGAGLGSNPATGARFDTTNITYSENSYLQVGIELGVGAMIAFIAMYLALLRRLRDEARRRTARSDAAAGMWLAGWALFVGGFFLHVWTLFPVSLTFWGLAGAALGPPIAAARSAATRWDDEEEHGWAHEPALSV